MGRALPVDFDVVIAGAILADVGKLLEYEIGPDGKSNRASAEKPCATHSPASLWRSNAEFPTMCATSLRRTLQKAIS